MASTCSLVLLLLCMMMLTIVVDGRHDMFDIQPTLDPEEDWPEVFYEAPNDVVGGKHNSFRFKPILDPEEDWPNN